VDGKRIASTAGILCALALLLSPAHAQRAAVPSNLHEAAGWLSCAFPREIAGFAPDRPDFLNAFVNAAARSGLEPGAVAALPPGKQAAFVRKAVRSHCGSLLNEISAGPMGPRTVAGEMAQAQEYRRAVRDLLTLSSLFDEGERSSLVAELKRAQGEVQGRIDDCSGRLVEEALKRLERHVPGTRWQGRTAIVDFPDGPSLALKFAHAGADDSKESESLQREGRLLRRAGSWGLAVPDAVAGGEGRHAWAFDGREVGKKVGSSFMPYLMHRELAGKYLSYQGSALDQGLPREERSRIVRAAAMKGIEDMNALDRRGWIHESLAPISHSEAVWEWDFLRETQFTFRYGPSSLHDWASALGFSNLRLSGLADFEHLAPVKSLELKKLKHLRGQNLAEWALTVMLAGERNSLSVPEIASILEDGIRLHAWLFLGHERLAEVEGGKLAKYGLKSAKKFHSFYRRANSLPRWAVECANAFAGLFSGRFLKLGEGLILSGRVVQPLVMGLIRPYVNRLQPEPATPRDEGVVLPEAVIHWLSLGYVTAVIGWKFTLLCLAGLLLLVNIVKLAIWWKG
jgi:hypothetical protein